MESTSQSQSMLLVSSKEWTQLNKMVESILDRISVIDLDSVLTPKEYIGVKEAIKTFSMCRSQFEQLRRIGIIKTYKVKGKIYVKTAEIREVFKNSAQ